MLVRDAAARFYGYRMEYDDGMAPAVTPAASSVRSVCPRRATTTCCRTSARCRKRNRIGCRSSSDARQRRPDLGAQPRPGSHRLLAGRTPLCSCTDANGVRHELSAIDDPRDNRHDLQRSSATLPLVLADGHHRFETACNYRNELRGGGDPVDGADAIMMFVVELVDEELCIEPIHRLLEPPPGVDVRARLAGHVRHSRARSDQPRRRRRPRTAMRAEHGLGLVDRAGLALIVPDADARAAALAGEHPAVAATDTAVVEAMIGPRFTDATWQYRHDAQAIATLVDKHTVTAAILCTPVSVAQTRRRGRRPRAHASEDDVLRAQTPHRNGLPHPRLRFLRPKTRGYSTVQVGAERRRSASSPGPERSWASAS